jgi:Tfp pilus assembly protein PilF
MSDQVPLSASEAALARYRVAVSALEGAAATPVALYQALLLRDQVADLVEWQNLPAEGFQELADLDGGLRKAAGRVRNPDWDAWRRATLAPPERWWWWLDQAQTKEAEERDFLWVLLAGMLMTITLGLGADISLRLWGSGAGALSVVSVILTMILTGGPLTSQGRQLAKWLMDRLHLPLRYRGSTMLAAASLFLLIALALRLLALPAWARLYNNRGVGLLLAGDLVGAQRSFDRAVSIDPDYAVAYYNLGQAYIDLSDFDQATSLFRRALAADRTFDLAYNGLGYVLTLQGEPDRAVPVLYTGLSVAQDAESQVALLTNLGRAYLGSGRTLEAETALNQALALDPQEAAAHCTLALVAEELERPLEQVRLDWENCLSYADPTTPQGQEMADRARAHLRTVEEVP